MANFNLPSDNRNQDEIELERVGLAIATVANRQASNYELDGKKVGYGDLDRLIILRDRLRFKVNRRYF